MMSARLLQRLQPALPVIRCQCFTYHDSTDSTGEDDQDNAGDKVVRKIEIKKGTKSTGVRIPIVMQERKNPYELPKTSAGAARDSIKGTQLTSSQQGSQFNIRIQRDTSKYQVNIGKYQTDTSKYQIDTSLYRHHTSKHKVNTSKYHGDTGKHKVDATKHQADISKYQIDTSKYQIDTGKQQSDTGKQQSDTGKQQDDAGKHQHNTVKYQVQEFYQHHPLSFYDLECALAPYRCHPQPSVRGKKETSRKEETDKYPVFEEETDENPVIDEKTDENPVTV